jgi:uncharacterized protein (TIGR02588 family)
MSNDTQRNENHDGQTKHVDSQQRSIAEWITLAVSLAIVIGIVTLITWLHFSGDDRPAMITVEPHMDQLRQEESGYYLPVMVRNDGGATVEDVQVQAELDMGSGEPETADFTITFLVGGEQVEGTFIFQEDPSSGELTTSAGSYKLP